MLSPPCRIIALTDDRRQASFTERLPLRVELADSNQHVLKGLMTFRSELAGRINLRVNETEAMRRLLINVDLVMPFFANQDEEIDPQAIAPRKRFPRKGEWFAYKEQSRLIREVLRDLPDGEAVPMATIVKYAMRKKGFDPEHDRSVWRIFYQKLICQTRAMWVRGSVEKIGNGRGVTWRLRRIDQEAS